MTTPQIPFLVEGILILAAGLFGILLGRAGKPRGKVKVAFHLFFFLWFTVGFAYIASGLFSIVVPIILWVPVVIMGLMILFQLLTGILMLSIKKVGRTLPLIHIISAILLFLSDVSAFVLTGLHS